MDPAPPQILNKKIDGFKIISEPSYISGKDSTKIYKSNLLIDDLIWSFDDYIGEKKIFISPDGDSLVLFGSVYFGTMVKNDDEAAILEIRTKDKKVISFTYKGITEKSISDDVKKNGLLVMGGGWTDIKSILTIDSVDWKSRKVKFKQLVKDF